MRDELYIATIGYEAASPTAFDEALMAAGVDVVVDVRAVAVSRRKGFSKTVLANRLEDQGLSYVHLRDLGDPKPGRDAARRGDFAAFRTIFDAHLTTDGARAALKSLEGIATSRRVALLCYEAEAETCHRSIVANHIANSANLSIVHLRVAGQANGNGRARADNHIGEGMAPPERQIR